MILIWSARGAIYIYGLISRLLATSSLFSIRRSTVRGKGAIANGCHGGSISLFFHNIVMLLRRCLAEKKKSSTSTNKDSNKVMVIYLPHHVDDVGVLSHISMPNFSCLSGLEEDLSRRILPQNRNILVQALAHSFHETRYQYACIVCIWHSGQLRYAFDIDFHCCRAAILDNRHISSNASGTIGNRPNPRRPCTWDWYW